LKLCDMLLAFHSGTPGTVVKPAPADDDTSRAEIIDDSGRELDRPLLTRDVRRYRAYFPELTLLAPEA